MSKGLEALKDIKQLLSTIELAGKKDKAFVNGELGLIEKELRALKVIKKLFEANVLGVLKTNDNRYFLRIFGKAYEINKEEYDLLKEELE